MYIPGTTCLHILLAHPCLYYYYLLSPQYTVLHILFYCTFYSLFIVFFLPICIFSCAVLHFLHCPLSGPDLIYISLLIIFCIIEYVTNKRTLDLEIETFCDMIKVFTVIFIKWMCLCWVKVIFSIKRKTITDPKPLYGGVHHFIK